jgi:hypothetical protein
MRPTLPRPVADAALAASAGRLHLLGGRAASGLAKALAPTRETMIFSPMRDSWSSGPALPAARSGGVAVATEDRLHLLGGRQADGDPALAETLDTIRLTWLETPQPRGDGRAACASEGALYLLSPARADQPAARLETCVVESLLYLHERVEET